MTAGADGNNGSPVTTDATSPDAKRRGTRPVAAPPRLAAPAMDAADPSRVHHRPGGEGGASGIPRPTANCGTAGPVLIRLFYEVDPLTCPRCGGEMRVIALIQEPAVIDKILRHLREKGRDARAGPWATGPPGGGAGAGKE